MGLETLNSNNQQILDCDVKDETGLNDYQKIPDPTAIEIDKVGIERFRIPLMFKHSDGRLVNHDAEASMFVKLQAGKTGVNMSRFCKILQEESENSEINGTFVKQVLNRYRKDLRDYETEDLIPEAFLSLNFNYAMKQPSLKSGNWGWQYYQVKLSGIQDSSTTKINLTIRYEYSSTCPCSLSMAKQYEEDYREGRTTEGNGIASAHSQRSVATVRVQFDESSNFSIEDLVQHCRTAIPTETQSLVKRVDEQAFAILNGDNPMFVEHASRRLSNVLDGDSRILDWEAKVEHIESLHSHNAVAIIRKRGSNSENFIH